MADSIPVEPVWQVTPKRGNQINSTAISGDGSRMVLGTSKEYDSGQFAVYCYNAEGTLLWQQPISSSTEPVYQGVFWVAISRDGKYAAAGGEKNKDSDGFLFAYEVETGKILLDQATSSRINQVSLSNCGDYLLAAFGTQVSLFQLDADQYKMIDSYSVESKAYINSAMLSNQANRAVLSVIQYINGEEKSASVGSVIALNISNGTFSVQDKTIVPAGPLRVSIIDSGQWWGASLHDGSCVVFNDFSETQPVWRYVPEEDTGVAYAFSIVESDSRYPCVAYGANIENHDGSGCIYALDSVVLFGEMKPKLIWKSVTHYGVNPGVNMDLKGRYVTGTDGAPGEKKESPGNFYLFDRESGQQLWDFPTSMMNWPMSIAANGSAIFGASDNGTAYYWRANSA